MNVTAPGKVMVAGEYAVLSHGAAVVMAVDRYATAVSTPTPSGEAPPEVRAALACARREGLLTREHSVRVETSGFAQQGRKLGLGSSAAGCVAAVGAAAAAEGHDVQALRPDIARIARTGHREAQGGGSGTDVLASALGGLLHVCWPDGLEGQALVTPLRWPENLTWSVFWTKTEARTSTLIRSVQAFGQKSPDQMARWMDAIGLATDEFTEALKCARADRAVRAVSAHMEAMDQLGSASNTPIVTEAMRQLAAATAPLGAAVKPSGAGGGDIVIVVMQDPDSQARVGQAAQDLGFVTLDLHLDAHGVKLAQGISLASFLSPTD
jgi:phosphomevalonate kinase